MAYVFKYSAAETPVPLKTAATSDTRALIEPVRQVEGQSWRSVCVGYARGKYGKYAVFATNAAFKESNSTALVCKNRDRRETFLPPTSNLCSDAVEKTIPDIRVS